MNLCKPFKNCFSVTIPLWVLCTWTQLTFKTIMFWIFISQVHGLKVGVLEVVGFKPFPLGEEGWSCEFFPDWMSWHCGWSWWWDCVSASAHFDVVLFSFAQCIGVVQLVFRFLWEEIVLADRFGLSTGGGELRIFFMLPSWTGTRVHYSYQIIDNLIRKVLLM